jgi:RNA 3'-terminal phosphate cyclase (ATP)
MNTKIIIDGARGEGGGQILRSALSLSICTGQPFHIKNIRAGRAKPGLMRQHLTCVEAAVAISNAKAVGATIGSTELQFTPDTLRPEGSQSGICGGAYNFAIGSAGSVMLVLQTILPPLLMAKGLSEITLRGGTHNGMAPPFEFLTRAFLPLLKTMGADVTLKLDRHGFYPAGGGGITAYIAPCRNWKPLHLMTRGPVLKRFAEAIIASVPADVAKRELAIVGEALGLAETDLHIRGLHPSEGPGNALLLTLEYAHCAEVFMRLGEKGLAAEAVAKKLLRESAEYVKSEGAVSAYLADQLLLPLALGAGGEFTTVGISDHFKTNVHVIQQFLPVSVVTTIIDPSCHHIIVRP